MMRFVGLVAFFVGVCHAGDFPDGLSEPLTKLAQQMAKVPANPEAAAVEQRLLADAKAQVAQSAFVESSDSRPLTIHLEEPRQTSTAAFRETVRKVLRQQKQQMEKLVAHRAKASFAENPIQDMMDQYAKIADILANQRPSASFVETSADAKPIVEVRLSAPEKASWDPLLSGLMTKREELESHYLALFRKALASKKASFLQASSTPFNVEVGELQQAPQDLVDLVIQSEKKLNEAERQSFETALAQINSRDAHVLAEDDTAELRFGAGSKPFTTFYDAVKKMEETRTLAEQRTRSELISLLNKSQ